MSELRLPSSYEVRALRRSDLDKGYLQLLSQLTVAGSASAARLLERFDEIQCLQPSHRIVVIEGRHSGCRVRVRPSGGIRLSQRLASLQRGGQTDEHGGQWHDLAQQRVSHHSEHRRGPADRTSARVVATGTLLVELKFYRDCGSVGHIEDVVVDGAHRGAKLGLRIVNELVAAARDAGCYKVILDCGEGNVDFYAKSGFRRKEVHMAQYL